MLNAQATLMFKKNIDISKFYNPITFLKKKSVEYTAKKSQIF